MYWLALLFVLIDKLGKTIDLLLCLLGLVLPIGDDCYIATSSSEALQASVGRASLQRVTWTSSKAEAEAAKSCNTCRGHSKTCDANINKPRQDCTMKKTESSNRCGLFPLHQRLECFLESWSSRPVLLEKMGCQWVSMPSESDIYQSSKAWALSQPSFTCLPNLRRVWSLERQGSNVAHVQMHTQDSMHTASSRNMRYIIRTDMYGPVRSIIL